MRVSKDSNITQTRWMEFYSNGDLTPAQTTRLEQFQRIVFTFEEFATQKAWDFFKDAVLQLLPAFDLYMVFSETLPQKKTRVRSHKKMFYPVRDAVAPNDRFDAEVDTGEDQSVLTGAIRLSPSNLDFCVDNLINSTLQFTYVVRKETSFTHFDWDVILKDMVDESIRSGRMLSPNIPKILLRYAGEDRALILLKNTGRDEQTVQFFVQDEGVRSVLARLEASYRAEVEN